MPKYFRLSALAGLILGLFLFLPGVAPAEAMNGYSECGESQPYFDDCYIGCEGDTACQDECCIAFPECCQHEEEEPGPCDGVVCGDGVCDIECDEECTWCPEDCGECPGDDPCGEVTCGDGVCDEECDEACDSCPDDCGECPGDQTGGPVWCCYHDPSTGWYGIDYVSEPMCVPGTGLAISVYQTEAEVRANCQETTNDPGGEPHGECDFVDCGDGVCQPECDETCENCPGDCGECPGDEPHGECDFVDCGDGVCQPECDETCYNCPWDCGECEEDPCAEVDCGDGVCQEECDEFCDTCPDDCGECYEPSPCDDSTCGDGMCVPECDEGCENCPGDCGECLDPDQCDSDCGDGVCDSQCGEGCENCPDDCGECDPCRDKYCGDGECRLECGENCESCSADCGECADTCGDDVCQPDETCVNCPDDCGGCSSVTAPVDDDDKSAAATSGTCCACMFLPGVCSWICPWLLWILIVGVILSTVSWFRRRIYNEKKRLNEKRMVVYYMLPVLAFLIPVVIAILVNYCWGIIAALIIILLRWLVLRRVKHYDDRPKNGEKPAKPVQQKK